MATVPCVSLLHGFLPITELAHEAAHRADIKEIGKDSLGLLLLLLSIFGE